MSDFINIQNPVTKQWTILAPHRSKRPQEGEVKVLSTCPFCPGREGEEEELYRVPLEVSKETNPDQIGIETKGPKGRSSFVSSGPSGSFASSDWLVRVLPNKFPFTPHHEVIIHSPDHHKNFDELPLEQVQLIVKTYQQRFLTHKDEGFVYIFHNRGVKGGESLPHPHSQLTVIPKDMMQEIPTFSSGIAFLKGLSSSEQEEYLYETSQFRLFTPLTSEWPDEVWIGPKVQGRRFDVISESEIEDLSRTLQTLIQIYSVRHGSEFPFNFYIYPGVDWYLRLIPREKTLGGFELGTGISVNTQEPKETMSFIKMHLANPDLEKIKLEHRAQYHKAV